MSVIVILAVMIVIMTLTSSSVSFLNIFASH